MGPEAAHALVLAFVSCAVLSLSSASVFVSLKCLSLVVYGEERTFLLEQVIMLLLSCLCVHSAAVHSDSAP